jgi:hypothetical protein
VLAGDERFDTSNEIVEHHHEVPWVSASRLEPQPRGTKHTDSYQRQHIESNKRHLLRELVDGGTANREHRGSESP